MNMVWIILDTFRRDHVGAYGNDWIRTPALDRLAAESVVYTNAYAESLPTLQVRRALHTGLRTFPFAGHRNYKGDFVGAPGWGPIPEEQDTVAEILKRHGYRTAFITDTYHQFKPSKNFHRGFDEWNWVRGQELDPSCSGPEISDEQIKRHLPECWRSKFDEVSHAVEFHRAYLRNVARRRSEEDYFPARVFGEAARWLYRNRDAERFFLVVDSFDPHEPWDPPDYYRALYDPDDDGCADVIQSGYRRSEDFLTERELKRLRANYAGECSLVDRWLGHFIEQMELQGLLENTWIGVVSDHGHSLGEHGLVAKTGYFMSPEIADLVLMIRPPGGLESKGPHGATVDKLVYNLDMTATLLARLGVDEREKMFGRDVWPAELGGEGYGREHTSTAWGPFVMVRKGDWYFNDYLWGEIPMLFNLADDPKLERNVAAENPELCKELIELAVADAGGKMPEYFRVLRESPGCTPFIPDEK